MIIAKKAKDAGLTEQIVRELQDVILSIKEDNPEGAMEMSHVLKSVQDGDFRKADEILGGMDGKPWASIMSSKLFTVLADGLEKFNPKYYRKIYV